MALGSIVLYEEFQNLHRKKSVMYNVTFSREFISCFKVEEFNDKDQIQFWCKFIVVPRLVITTGGSSFSVQAKP